MKRVELPAEPRTSLGSGAARRFRRSGQVPGVLYGHGEPRPVLIEGRGLDKALRTGAGMNVVINFKIQGVDELAIVRDVQRNSLTRAITHADFQRILLTEKITTTVPLELVGVAPALKEGGLLMQMLREVEVEALPLSIPERISVDVSKLAAIGDLIHVGDITLPEGVDMKTGSDVTVVNIAAPAAEEVAPVAEAGAAVAAAPGATGEPEVITKGKEEKKDEGAAKGAPAKGAPAKGK